MKRMFVFHCGCVVRSFCQPRSSTDGDDGDGSSDKIDTCVTIPI